MSSVIHRVNIPPLNGCNLYKTSMAFCSAERGRIVVNPGLNRPLTNQSFIAGLPNSPPHNAFTGYFFSSSLLWNNSCNIFFIISSYLYSRLSQGNTPSSVCVAISGSIPGAQGEGKKGTQAWNSVGMGVDRCKIIWPPWSFWERSCRYAAEFQPQIFTIHTRHKGTARSSNRKTEHQGSSHDFDEGWVLNTVGSVCLAPSHYL